MHGTGLPTIRDEENVSAINTTHVGTNERLSDVSFNGKVEMCEIGESMEEKGEFDLWWWWREAVWRQQREIPSGAYSRIRRKVASSDGGRRRLWGNWWHAPNTHLVNINQQLLKKYVCLRFFIAKHPFIPLSSQNRGDVFARGAHQKLTFFPFWHFNPNYGKKQYQLSFLNVSSIPNSPLMCTHRNHLHHSQKLKLTNYMVCVNTFFKLRVATITIFRVI